MISRIRFRTETGSVYEVNYQLGTWKREVTAAESGMLRNESGILLKSGDGRTQRIGIVVGCRAALYDTSVLPDHSHHCALTSRVTEILDFDTANDGPEVDVIENERNVFPGEDTYGVRVHLGGRFSVVHERVDDEPEGETNG